MDVHSELTKATRTTGKDSTGRRNSQDVATLEVVAFKTGDGLQLYLQPHPELHDNGYAAGKKVVEDDVDLLGRLRMLIDPDKLEGQEFADVNTRRVACVKVHTSGAAQLEVNGDVLREDANLGVLPGNPEVW